MARITSTICALGALTLAAITLSATGVGAAEPDASVQVGPNNSDLPEQQPGPQPESGFEDGSAATATEQPPQADGADPFKEAVKLIESIGGAYDPSLSEHLMSLGLTLQREGRHEEAVKVFKRGAHLTRINNGLHGAEQIPLLMGEIRSRLALGQYTEADERQQYMYRVQVRSLNSGTPRAMALMQQAGWQYSAYQLGLGEVGYPRLVNMWDLYLLALNDVIEMEGETSPALLEPLEGMLKAQYLIAGYDGGTETAGFSSDTYDNRQQQGRFYAYRSQSYEKGQAVINAIYDIQREQHGADSVETAEARVMLGDWFQWHGDRQDAAQSYREALAELMTLENAQQEVGRLFGEPVALPDVAGVRPLPRAEEAGAGRVLLEYGVTETGRVVNLERLDENSSIDGKANRLMRKLRQTPFRPRFEAGEPVATDKLVRAYEVIQ